MKKVLVTGAAGFIGSHICDYLLSQNYIVAAIDDLSSGNLDNLSNSVQFFQQDICDAEAAHTIRKFKPDIIVHAAAQMSVSQSMKDPVFDVKVNLEGMLNILTACQDKLPYFLFISTGGALYGEQDVFPASENHAIHPTSVYGQSKYCAETYLGLWQRIYGLKYGVLRLANVYGPRQNPHGEAGVVAIFMQKLFKGETPIIFGTGAITRDYIYVADVVAAVAKMLDKEVEDTFNIGTAKETSVNDLYKFIAKAANTDIRAAYGSSRPGDQARSVITSKKAKEKLNWEAKVSLTEGIEKTAEWFS